jgi:hypothetical protein
VEERKLRKVAQEREAWGRLRYGGRGEEEVEESSYIAEKIEVPLFASKESTAFP